jgi:hypothetical protein
LTKSPSADGIVPHLILKTVDGVHEHGAHKRNRTLGKKRMRSRPVKLFGQDGGGRKKLTRRGQIIEEKRKSTRV